MVRRWIKQLNSIKLVSKIDFDKIILDILEWNYSLYDIKSLVWYDELYRLRIWKYRIIFKNNNWDIKVLFLWKRWDVYKWLNNL